MYWRLVGFPLSGLLYSFFILCSNFSFYFSDDNALVGVVFNLLIMLLIFLFLLIFVGGTLMEKFKLGWRSRMGWRSGILFLVRSGMLFFFLFWNGDCKMFPLG